MLSIDERSKRKLEETATGVLGLFYVICTFEMIIKFFVTKDISSILGEFIIFLSVIFTFLIVQRFHRSYSPTLPRKNNGELLSAENTKQAKHKRLLIYAKDSFVYSISFTAFSVVMDYLTKKQDITFNLEFFVSQFFKIILYFIPFFILDSLLKERKIKKYNKWNDDLDD
ncbi:DUF6773 family protein [Clostridium folliculivorans]|uniref:DUF6773 family protein n=1 Tax=Clostridium folliculivorans TaxID=2886038 RepID=UPI0021C35D6A|nr:DUF6773 family protein [Clostridium folliculivorans]GKU30465.1 hypothetical protein CFB3_25720 [Clostridium folliculivorans]